MTPRFVKRLGLAAGAAVAAPAIARRLLRDRGVIFMLHRFSNPDLGVAGHDPADLRRSLEYLRGRGFELVSLDDLLRRLAADGPRPRGAIAFTVDDGYADQASIGAPIFAEFDCPVTTFLTTGFVDGAMWFWWDRVNYVFTRTRARRVRAHLGDQVLQYDCGSRDERRRAGDDFVALCKAAPEDAKEQAIRDLAIEADVPLPTGAPIEYAPMTWDMVRTCESRGMSFGPHTVTHPILSRTDDERSEYEIVESWRRLQEETRTPAPCFCYPNGQPDDYGAREMRTLERIGMMGAVAGWAAYAHAQGVSRDRLRRFEIPRFSWPGGVSGLAQYASGLARVKQAILGRV